MPDTPAWRAAMAKRRKTRCVRGHVIARVGRDEHGNCKGCLRSQRKRVARLPKTVADYRARCRDLAEKLVGEPCTCHLVMLGLGLSEVNDPKVEEYHKED